MTTQPHPYPLRSSERENLAKPGTSPYLRRGRPGGPGEVKVSDEITYAQKILHSLSDAPVLDAQRLLLFVLGQKETSWLFAHGDQILTSAQEAKFQKLVQERITGKPLAYILGTAEFYGREFIVTPDVLIPRPETEDLIEKALSYINRPMVIADIGTGSGCIAITLALEFAPPYEGGVPANSAGGVVIIATDISASALEIAHRNAAKHGVLDKIEFLEGNMLEPLAGKKIDLIISNPPYIPSLELTHPPSKETTGLAFEPKIALDGGPDGQTYIDQIKASGIPAIAEVTGGKIAMFNVE